MSTVLKGFFGIAGLVHIIESYDNDNMKDILEDIDDLKWYLENTEYTKKQIIEEIEFQKAVVKSVNDVMKTDIKKRKIEIKIYL